MGDLIKAPVNIQFNVAVLTMANKFCVRGWAARPNAPDTLYKLKLSIIENGGMILVSDEHCDKTIFYDEEVNIAFRAWHDWTHAHFGYEFTPTGEFQTFLMQAFQIMNEYGYNAQTKVWIDLLDIEINQQIKHEKRHGMFPIDQKAFALACLEQGPEKALELAY